MGFTVLSLSPLLSRCRIMQRLWNALLWVPGSSLILQSPARLRPECSDSQPPTSGRQHRADNGDSRHGGPEHLGRHDDQLPGLGDDNLLPDDGGDEGPQGGLLAPDGQHLADLEPVRLLLPHREIRRTLVHGKEVILNCALIQYNTIHYMNFAGSLTIWNPLCRFTTFSKLYLILGFSTKSSGCGEIITIGTVSLWTIHTGF